LIVKKINVPVHPIVRMNQKMDAKNVNKDFTFVTMVPLALNVEWELFTIIKNRHANVMKFMATSLTEIVVSNVFIPCTSISKI
jgi:hypothetical protein